MLARDCGWFAHLILPSILLQKNIPQEPIRFSIAAWQRVTIPLKLCILLMKSVQRVDALLVKKTRCFWRPLTFLIDPCRRSDDHVGDGDTLSEAVERRAGGEGRRVPCAELYWLLPSNRSMVAKSCTSLDG